MHKRKVKAILASFMITCILGMGFTGYKVTAENKGETPTYIAKDETSEVNDEELREDNPNFIEILESRVDVQLVGYSLIVEEDKIGTFKNSKEIEEVLEEIKEEYTRDEDENTIIKDIEIQENVDIIKEDVYLKDIDKKEEVIEYIKTGGEELKTHTIEVGESFSTISKIYDIDREDLKELNPDKDEKKLQISDEITIKNTKPLMTVITKEELESEKSIEYEIEVEEDPNMYKTESEVKVEGQQGKEKITTKQIKHNGKLVTEKIINKEIIEEPIDQVVIKGTKEKPKTEPTGSFLMPTRGRLSSPFGRRWGRMHRGIDIAKAHGSDIQSSDGGTITFSGVMGSYGNMIEVDHGNGYKTRYAHCSKLLFSVGQKVHKGQVIAKVGNTGRSTGPHVHFEVIKNGVHQNPSKYVK